ncbi:MAG: selenium-dependent molybdenum cofactor biosynthesis protein YqeB [Bacteroidota bacterium]
MKPMAVIRGAGDLGTAVGRKLLQNGFRVVHLEIAEPLVVRRTVAFASAIFDGGTATVEGVAARLAADADDARAITEAGDVAVLIDPGAASLPALEPVVLVDAILAKRNTGTRRAMAPFVVGLGPGFTAGVDVHAVVETCRGADLGRVITEGAARPDTGIPGEVGGVTAARVLRASRAGTFRALRYIGDPVRAGDPVAESGGEVVRPTIAGVLRGILHSGLTVRSGQKVGDVDPRGDRALCFRISDKANAVAAGVLHAVFRAEEALAPEGRAR